MKTERAVTFLEMLCALTIIIVLTAFSFPAWNYFVAHQQEVLLQEKLFFTLKLARQEAQARNIPTRLCQSQDQRTCSGTWSDGWLLFADSFADGRVHTQEQIIFTQILHLKQAQLYWRQYPRSRQFIRFMPQGLLTVDNGSFWYCVDGQRVANWGVTLSKTGRVNLAAKNKPFTC